MMLKVSVIGAGKNIMKVGLVQIIIVVKRVNMKHIMLEITKHL